MKRTLAIAITGGCAVAAVFHYFLGGLVDVLQMIITGILAVAVAIDDDRRR